MTKMNLVNKLEQDSVKSFIEKTNWNDGTKNPFVVELDPTTVCDLACPGCISGDLLNMKDPISRGFSSERLEKISEEFIEAKVRAVILIGGGEPLAHPSTIKIIEKLGKAQIQIGLTTNGTLMHKNLDIIAKYVDWVRVSIDGGSDEMFLKLRPTKNKKSKFNIVIENMKKLAKIKKGILGYSFLIRTKSDGMVLNPAGKNLGLVDVSNINEIYMAAKLAKDIGCDYFELKPSYDDFHQLVVHDQADMDLAKEELKKAKKIEDDNFKVLESVMLESALKREKMGDQIKEYNNCPSAELRTLVTPSGVYVCPYFRGEETMKIGDLRYESLQEMWNGEKRKKIVGTLDPSKKCANLHCIRHDTNIQVLNMIKNKNKNLKKINNNKKEDLFI